MTLEQAARAEAERRNPLRLPYNAEFERRAQRPDQWEECASWLAEYLLSDDNVEKAARGAYDGAFLRHAPEDVDRWEDLVADNDPAAESWRAVARSALQAVLGKDAS